MKFHVPMQTENFLLFFNDAFQPNVLSFISFKKSPPDTLLKTMNSLSLNHNSYEPSPPKLQKSNLVAELSEIPISQLTELKTCLQEDVYDILSTIKDPEFPTKTLGSLKTSVKNPKRIKNMVQQSSTSDLANSLSSSSDFPDSQNNQIEQTSIKRKLPSEEPTTNTFNTNTLRNALEKADSIHKNVINLEDIDVQIKGKNGIYHFFINITYTPTVAHCSLTSLIGLSIHCKLNRDFPLRCHDAMFQMIDEDFLHYFYRDQDVEDEEKIRFKMKILVFPGSHSTESEVNRQINDKERRFAALENRRLVEKIEGLIEESENDY